jgi:hypothetical protein
MKKLNIIPPGPTLPAEDIPESLANLLQPDFAMMERFCTLLDDSAEFFTFQFFDDQKSRGDGRLASIRHSTIPQLAKYIRKKTQAGAGVFIVPNETDKRGRRASNIVRCRAVWCEDDTPGAIKTFSLEPHIIVETSPGKFHYYWILGEGFTKENFTSVMNTMVKQYGSDPNAKDLARVLRLPGSIHQKDPQNPFLVRIVFESSAQPYSPETMLAAFPEVPLHDGRGAVSRRMMGGAMSPEEINLPGHELSPKEVNKIRAALGYIPADDRGIWHKVGMALNDTGAGDQAFGIWYEWSCQSDKFDSKNQRMVWNSFKPGRGISVATIFDLAKQHGFIVPQADRQPIPPVRA